MKLMSVDGAKALDAAGGSKTADLIRRAEPDVKGFAKELQLREIVQTMLVELSPPRCMAVVEKVKDADMAYQAFVVFNEAKQPFPSFAAVAHAVLSDTAFAVRFRVWNEGILIGLVALVKMPMWTWQRRRLIRALKRYQEWFRRYLVTIILQNGDQELLHLARNSHHFFNDDEWDRLQRDLRLGLAI